MKRNVIILLIAVCASAAGAGALRVKTLLPRGGEAVTVEFVADRAGSFDFTCAEYCGTGHARMKGRLVVVAPGAASFL